VLDAVNPAAYPFSAIDLLGNTGSAVSNVAQGNFKEAGSDLLNAGLNALQVIPAASELRGPLKSAGKYLTTQTPLKNTYKYNPWAFKPNPEAYYRGIGRTGLDDALESGVLRPGNKTGISFGEDVYTTTQFKSAKGNYSRDQPYGVGDPWGDDWKMVQPKDSRSYVAEIPESSFTNKIRATNSIDPENIFLNRGHIPIDDVKLLKQDWLRGYKQIEVPNVQRARYSETIPSFPSMVDESIPYQMPTSTLKSIEPPQTYYRATTPESFANLSNPINIGDVGREKPGNLSFFTPSLENAKGTFSEYSANRVVAEANLLFKNPYKVRQGEVWTNSKIKQLMDDGYDAIQVNYDPSGNPRNAYEIIPLDKSVIQNAKIQLPEQKLGGWLNKYN
jgi:hypothetical protein